MRIEDDKVVRDVEIRGDHCLVFLKMGRWNRVDRYRSVEQNVKIRSGRLKDRRVSLKSVGRLKQKMSITRVKELGHKEESVEEIWKEFKEGILRTAVEVCRVIW